MKRSTVGALLLLVLGAAAIFGWKWLEPRFADWGQRRTSDAADVSTTFRIGGDNYLGYWFLTSPEMRKAAARRGMAVQFEDDGGAYADRLARFAAGDLDMIVVPVSSYLQHGATVDFPGVIVAGLAESRGADGMVGFADKLPSGKIEDLNDAELQVVYTGGSPSEFLLDLTIADFDLDELEAGDRWRREVGGSREVYQAAKSSQGDVFVLWEPDLSRALQLPGLTYVWGSDRFAGYIVDVIVVRRDVLSRQADEVRDFLELYFRVLRTYGLNREKMLDEMRKTTDLDADSLGAILDKIEWFDLEENRRQLFGLQRTAGERVEEGLVNTILSCTDVMVRAGRLDTDPLTGNPYLITNSSLLEELMESGIETVGESQTAEVTFEPLDEDGWARLNPVGTFRVEAVTFQSWDNRLTDAGKESVDRIAQLLTHNYPGYRVIIGGHTAPGGDEAENVSLSQARAEAVKQYLKAVHDLDADRLMARGLGSSEPPRRKPGESPRAYRYRLSRVELTALDANPL